MGVEALVGGASSGFDRSKRGGLEEFLELLLEWFLEFVLEWFLEGF